MRLDPVGMRGAARMGEAGGEGEAASGLADLHVRFSMCYRDGHISLTINQELQL